LAVAVGVDVAVADRVRASPAAEVDLSIGAFIAMTGDGDVNGDVNDNCNLHPVEGLGGVLN